MDFAWFSTWTAEGVTAVGTMLQGIFVGAATIGGFLAFNNWKREQIGGRKIEVAEEALALMYEAQDVFRGVRSAFFSYTDAELTEFAEKNEMSSEEASSYLTNSAPLKRMSEQAEFFKRMYAIKPKVLVLLGREAAEVLEEMQRVRVEIQVATEVLVELMRHPDRDDEGYKKEVRECKSIAFDYNREDDLLKRRINQAISKMERIAGSYLR
jgi:hypothetical protein